MPTQRSAFIGLPSSICPRYNDAPYSPHDNTAPATNTTHDIISLRIYACSCVLSEPTCATKPRSHEIMLLLYFRVFRVFVALFCACVALSWLRGASRLPRATRLSSVTAVPL